MDYNLEMVKNFKLIFSTFKKLSDLKINFYKNELFFLGKPMTLSLDMLNYLYVIITISNNVFVHSNILS